VYLLIKVLLTLLVFLPLPKPQDAERNGNTKNIKFCSGAPRARPKLENSPQLNRKKAKIKVRTY
jgi:hypothetical protein